MEHGVVVVLLLCACTKAVLSRECIHIDGICVEDCPPGTHSYNSDCSGPTWSERTCRSPVPHDMGVICDLSRCDCNKPRVKNEITGKCVLLKDCTRNY